MPKAGEVAEFAEDFNWGEATELAENLTEADEAAELLKNLPKKDEAAEFAKDFPQASGSDSLINAEKALEEERAKIRIEKATGLEEGVTQGESESEQADIGIDEAKREEETKKNSEGVDDAEAAARAAGILEDEIPAFLEFYSRAAGQFGETSNAIKAFKYLSNGEFDSMAEMLNLSSPAGKAVFWSGNYSAAAEYANSIGGTTLESTPGGSIFNNWDWLNKKFPTWGDGTATDQRRLWGAISSRYAELVNGPVYAVQKDGVGGYVWNNYELTVLQQRGIQIIYIKVD